MDFSYSKRILSVFMIMFCFFNVFSQTAEDSEARKEIDELITHGTSLFESQKYGEAINSFMEATSLGEKEDFPSLTCLAYYNLGVVYFHISETAEAIANFRKAYEICKQYNLGPIREVEIVAGIAGVHFELEEYGKSKQLLKEALKIAKNNNDSIMLAHIWENMALISNKTHDFDSTMLYLNEARRFISNDEPLKMRIKEIEADRYRMTGDNENAYLILREMFESPQSDISDNIYVSFLDILSRTGRFDEAIKMEDSISSKISLPYKANFFNIMSGIYSERGLYKKALAYKDSSAFYKDKIAQINNQRQIENSNVKFDILKYQMESDRKVLEMRSKVRLWIIISLIFFILLIVALAVTAYIRYKSKNDRAFLNLQLEKEQNEKRIAQEKMEETEKFAKYRQEMLKRNIEQKNRELEAHLMFMNSRNDLLENLTNYINQDNALTELPAVKKLLQYIKRLQNSNEKDKENFLLNHEAADPEFTGKLLKIHPELLQSDVKFLSYIRMNLSSKEISNILNITPDSCKRRKIRISKKLNLATSSDLYPYLVNL